MKVFFDTNLVVAACLEDHEHHERAFQLLERVLAKKDTGYISAHALVEAYSVMTRLPKPLRVAPSLAARLLQQNFHFPFHLVVPSASDYTTFLDEAGQKGWVGGLIYDALHVLCAVQADVDWLYSWNSHHLQTVAPSGFRARIVTP